MPEPITATRIESVECGKGTGFDSHPEESRRAKAMKINEELLLIHALANEKNRKKQKNLYKNRTLDDYMSMTRWSTETKTPKFYKFKICDIIIPRRQNQ